MLVTPWAASRKPPSGPITLVPNLWLVCSLSSSVNSVTHPSFSSDSAMAKRWRQYVTPFRMFDDSGSFSRLFLPGYPSTHFWYYPNLNAIGIVHDHPSHSHGYEVVSHQSSNCSSSYSQPCFSSFCLLVFNTLPESLLSGLRLYTLR